MTSYFVGIFTIYLVLTLITNVLQKEEQPRRSSPVAAAIQAPLFLIACLMALEMDAINREIVSVPRIGLGIIIGHVVFALSVVLTQGSISAATYQFLSGMQVLRFLGNNPALILRFLIVSLTEEIIYRVAAQYLAITYFTSPLIGIVAVAVLFSVTHWHFFRNPPLQSLEFVLFALLLGGVYYATASLSLVVVIHGVRNLEIVYLEYLAHKDELGSAEAAQQKIDETYTRRAAQAA